MKTILLAISAILLAAKIAAATSYFTIRIQQDGTNTVLSMQDGPVSLEKVQEVTAKVGLIDASQMVLVIVDAKIPAEALLSVMKVIKDSGLKKICILPWQERKNLDVLSVEIMAKTNEFTETYYGTLHEVDDLLEELPGIEPNEKQGEQAGPGYPPQSVGSPDP